MTRTESLARALARAVDAARAAGVPDVDRWSLQTGSRTYGRAYRLFSRDPETGGLSSVIGSDGFLGMTSTEAARSLDMIATGLRLAKG